MKKTLAMIAVAGVLALAGAGTASAQTSDTNLPGGDVLETSLYTQGNWAGTGISCITVQSNVTLYGTTPYYAQSIKNVTTLDAYGYYPTLSWRGINRSGGKASVSLTDSYTNGYDWRSDMGGAACVPAATPYLDGVAQGSAYVPSEGGWFYANAGLD